ncbi:MAG: hydrogenase maturation peptidase HycI, partial [Dehalococcoidia bacterium]
MSGTIVMGIGNRLGGDDAAGTIVADMLNQKRQRLDAPLQGDITIIDAGTAPESYTSVIRQRRPDLLILVDAADMGLPSGASRTITPDRISTVSFSTHHMPLSMFVSYVTEFCGKVLLVGIQPERTETGSGISKAVRTSVGRLVDAILQGQISEIPVLEKRG